MNYIFKLLHFDATKVEQQSLRDLFKHQTIKDLIIEG